MKKIFLITLALFMSACTGKSLQETGSFEKRKAMAELTSKKIKEASGLVSSINNPGMLWTHNDSGNDAQIFLIDENLDIKATVTLAGVENRDWEDITVGPGPDSTKQYVYVGDIGDNDAAHQYKYIYRFEEPTIGSGNSTITISDADKITFQLSDQIKDTESLMIDPNTKNLYLISKRENPVFLYELKYPQTEKDTLVAFRMMELPFTSIVAADYSSKNGSVLMKNYQHIYYWENKNKVNLLTLLKERPVEIPYEAEPQGESIAWKNDGTGFYTLSEKKKREPSFLYLYSLRND